MTAADQGLLGVRQDGRLSLIREPCRSSAQRRLTIQSEAINPTRCSCVQDHRARMAGGGIGIGRHMLRAGPDIPLHA